MWYFKNLCVKIIILKLHFRLEIENAKLKVTVKKQVGKIEQLQKNLLSTGSVSQSFNFCQAEKEFYLFIYLFIVFCLFRATSTAYGGSQARGLIGAVALGLRQSQSATYTIAHSIARSLTH